MTFFLENLFGTLGPQCYWTSYVSYFQVNLKSILYSKTRLSASFPNHERRIKEKLDDSVTSIQFSTWRVFSVVILHLPNPTAFMYLSWYGRIEFVPNMVILLQRWASSSNATLLLLWQRTAKSMTCIENFLDFGTNYWFQSCCWEWTHCLEYFEILCRYTGSHSKPPNCSYASILSLYSHVIFKTLPI